MSSLEKTRSSLLLAVTLKSRSSSIKRKFRSRNALAYINIYIFFFIYKPIDIVYISEPQSWSLVIF